MGVWVTPIQYRMTNPRTAAVRMLFLPQAAELDPHEIEDMVEEGKELFVEYLRSKGDHQTMPRSQQHDLGPHLQAIEASKRRVRETGNRRYH